MKTALVALSLLAPALSAAGQTVVVRPQEYPRALRNPLMGFRGSIDQTREYSQLSHVYVRWRDIEDKESDGIEKIRDYCDRMWRESGGWSAPKDPAKHPPVEALNVKVIPRVYLRWSKPGEDFWPSDMTPGDFSSDQFKRRALRLIERLGKVWDEDPRVAYVHMGLIGLWGEQHTPAVTPEMQKLLGDAFVRAFPHKLVMVRHPWDFTAYPFGIYWDSFAHADEWEKHGNGIIALGDRWKVAPIGGETAYNWGRYKVQPGDGPDDTLRDPGHRRFLIDTIRMLHANHVGWVADYDPKDPAVLAGAEEVQRALGYRLVLEEFRCPPRLEPGKPFDVAFTVRNTGSSPLYYAWPVELSLLDPATRQPVWKQEFRDLDVRKWLPGDRWDRDKQAYAEPPALNSAAGRFTLPRSAPRGEYILALAILDPAGRLPAVRFAIRNYFTGGRHPLARVGVGVQPRSTALSSADFDDPEADRTLHYVVTR